MKHSRSIACRNRCKTRAFNVIRSEVCSLPEVTSRIILKLYRLYIHVSMKRRHYWSKHKYACSHNDAFLPPPFFFGGGGGGEK